jgi:hypothetical protein
MRSSASAFGRLQRSGSVGAEMRQLLVFDFGGKTQARSALLSATGRNVLVDHDSLYPGSEVRTRPELVERCVRTCVRFLDQVLSVCCVASDAPGGGVEGGERYGDAGELPSRISHGAGRGSPAGCWCRAPAVSASFPQSLALFAPEQAGRGWCQPAPLVWVQRRIRAAPTPAEAA